MTAPEFTPEGVRSILIAAGFAEYDADDNDPMGFTAHKAAFGSEITVELRGVDTLPFNPGEGPKALLDDYARALESAGYAVRTPSGIVIVAGVKG